ncbi:DNA cytosine methyltransferase [Methanofollis formosanus]|uniref:DNA (cytosine-5-)-methyltransferase n=1 Tax=Methanofollis formosanus TaxID=299308 RepID=A0A8G1EG89_9EURY|nr:DNA cytosine methyltransferase [Methanofollis formosanus]QYZ78901.1 DNA cytosine methyltransferase [Methanofollis formosanus]
MKKQPIAVDLFSGCGGMTLGLKKAGFNVVAAVEVDKKIAQTYKDNHPKVKMYDEDIRDLDYNKLIEPFGLKRGDLDLLAGCPPCQGFSRIRRLNQPEAKPDDRNDLVNNYASIVEALYPKTVMMENVPGLERDTRFEELRKKLEKMGYKISRAVLRLENYGVPQRRKRLVLIATRTGKSPNVDDIKKVPQRTVRDAIGRLPLPEDSENPIHKLILKSGEVVRRRIAAIPKDGGSRSELPDDLVLPCHRNSKSKGFKDVYGRMSWDNISPTITCGCFNPSKGRFIHPEQNRPISIYEASLLQTFPKNYKFNPEYGLTLNAVMIGNALPPKFAEAAAKYVKKLL